MNSDEPGRAAGATVRFQALCADLRSAGGVMRVAELERRGYRRHLLRRLLEARLIQRPKQGWIALGDADPGLLFALHHGVLLSCVTVAQRRGLWVRQSRSAHLAVRAPGSRVSAEGHRVHWGRPIRKREPHSLVDSLENALNYVAQCQPHDEALAIWESALNKRLVGRDSLARFPLSGSARRILEQCTPFSDSGLETYVRQRLRALGLKVVPQAYLHGHRVDFLIEGWVVLQIDGGHHVGAQRESDNRHDALLSLNGYFPIRVGYRQVFEHWPDVQALVMNAVSQGRPRTGHA